MNCGNLGFVYWSHSATIWSYSSLPFGLTVVYQVSFNCWVCWETRGLIHKALSGVACA
jgi:hypothetical protein